MNDIRKYSITCYSEQDVDFIIEKLTTPGQTPTTSEDSSLLPAIKITDYYCASNNEVEVELTQAQFDELKYHPKIITISEITEEQCTNHTIGQKRIINPNFSSTNNSTPVSWAQARCSSLSAMPPWNQNFTYFFTGSSVDLIDIDGGITAGHPEYFDSNGVSRIKYVNWSNYAPLTASRTNTVTVANGYYYINGVAQNTVYVVKDKTANGSGTGYPASYRTGVYDFVLDASTASHPFFIGSAVNVPFDSRYVTGNGSTTGVVSLTVWPSNNALYNNNVQNTMYYWCGAHAGMGGVIARTDYNTQSDDNYFYTDNGGHGSHTAGTAAGSACGWATGASIYSIKVNFSDNYGYNTFASGLKLVYDLLTAWHKQKLLNPAISSRPTVTTNSYGWGTGTNYNDVDYKVKQLTDKGIHFVHAAGNDYALNLMPSQQDFLLYRTPSPTYPGSEWTTQENNPVIEVGALGGYNAIAYFKADYTNYGAGVSIYAPGTYIQSVWHNTGYATYPGYGSIYGLRKISGTSMATPNVAGVLCTMLDDMPGLTPLQAKMALMQNAITGAVSSMPGTYDMYDYGYEYGGNPLTLSQYPASIVATRPSDANFLKHFAKCYTKVSNIRANDSFYALSGIPVVTSVYMNSAADMQFVSNC